MKLQLTSFLRPLGSIMLLLCLGAPNLRLAQAQTQPPPGSVLWLKGDTGVVQDSQNLVTQWNDQSGQGNNATSGSPTGTSPKFLINQPGGSAALEFDGLDDYFSLASSPSINGDLFSAKTLSIVFKTGSDVTNRQVLWAQGDDRRGLNMSVASGKVSVGAWSSDVNLLDNPGFEQGQYKWVAPIPSAANNYALSSTLIQDASQAKTGSWYMRTNTGDSWCSQRVPVTPGNSYILKGWGKVDGAGWGVKSLLQVRDINNALLAAMEFTTTSYTQQAVTFTAPAGQTQVDVLVRGIYNDFGVKGAIDDVSLTLSPATTTWSPKFVSTTVSPNTTYHVKLVLDSIAGTLKGYCNSNLMGTQTGIGKLLGTVDAPSIGRSSSRTRYDFGVWRATGMGNHGGQIAEILMYNSALDAAKQAAIDDAMRDKYALPGVGTGLTGKYYSDKNLTTLVKTQIDPQINFNWGTSSPKNLDGSTMSSVGPDNFGVSWSGQVQAIEAGDYVFQTTTDDGVRLYLNDATTPQINKWVNQSATSYFTTFSLAQGQKIPLKMDYYENVGGASARLLWLRPGASNAVAIPNTQLYPTSLGPNLVTNSGFEKEQYNTQSPSDWGEWSSYTTDAGYTESYGGSHSGNYHGTHLNGNNYNMYTYQTKAGLANGLYTLRAWARSSGGQTTCQLGAKDFGSAPKVADLPVSSSYQLVEIKDINVTNGQCTIGVWSDAFANNYCYFDDVEFFKQ